MSGPTSAIIVVDPLAALLSALAIRAAERLQEAYAEAERLREAHRNEVGDASARRRSAAAQGREELLGEIAGREAALKDLLAAATRIGLPQSITGDLPARPDDQDPLRLAAYARTLAELHEALRSALLTEAARHNAAETDEGIDLAAIADRTAVDQPPSRRWLERIAHLGEVPAELAEIARELDACLPGERAALLATELRLQVQKFAEETQQRALAEASGTILLHSLKELGYQVEEPPATLFVEGGVLHFRRAGWGDHMVRLRLDAKRRSANFNVVRAVDLREAEASVLDHLAEDRWCAEFPALLAALEARGLRLEVTRRLQAGELPVQQVLRGELPRFADEPEEHQAPALQARSLK